MYVLHVSTIAQYYGGFLTANKIDASLRRYVHVGE